MISLNQLGISEKAFQNATVLLHADNADESLHHFDKEIQFGNTLLKLIELRDSWTNEEIKAILIRLLIEAIEIYIHYLEKLRDSLKAEMPYLNDTNE